jgi:hypothetical protein
MPVPLLVLVKLTIPGAAQGTVGLAVKEAVGDGLMFITCVVESIQDPL